MNNDNLPWGAEYERFAPWNELDPIELPEEISIENLECPKCGLKELGETFDGEIYCENCNYKEA